MLEILHLDIFGVLYADIIYAFCLLISTGALVQKSCGFRYGLLRSNIPSFIASAVMGVILFLLSNVLEEALSPIWLLIPGIVLGYFIYFIILFLLHGAAERQLRLIPGGKWICAIAKALRLL